MNSLYNRSIYIYISTGYIGYLHQIYLQYNHQYIYIFSQFEVTYRKLIISVIKLTIIMRTYMVYLTYRNLVSPRARTWLIKIIDFLLFSRLVSLSYASLLNTELFIYIWKMLGPATTSCTITYCFRNSDDGTTKKIVNRHMQFAACTVTVHVANS
jgi:hypothetical protein